MPDIKINAQQWNSLKKEEQDKIQSILQESGVLKSGKVVPDAQAPHIPELAGPEGKWPWCTAKCDVAEALAVAACGLLTGPAIPICVTAAHAAGGYCRSQC